MADPFPLVAVKEYFAANFISLLSLLGIVDAYRNKMRSTMLAAGQDPSSIPRHFETRAGKRRFLERRQRQGMSASQRSAEEVEA